MNLSTNSYKGTRDIYPDDMRLRQYIFDTWAAVCQNFGYERYDAPVLEPLEIYAAKSGEEIVSEQTYTFTDRGDRQVAIRPEMTPSVARMVAARRQEIALPARLYSIANFMRYERPQKGREREFWQLNVDLFGSTGVNADCELISIANSVLRKFGADSKMYTILIGDRRLTDYIMCEYLGLDESRASAMIKLFDRKSKITDEAFNAQAMEIFGENETENLGKVKDIISAETIADLPESVRENGPVTEVEELLSAVRDSGISNAKYDPTLMRGFDYYTGMVFEVFDNSPENNRSLFGGGRYDGLVGLFGVDDMPVVGFAPGETTTIEFLKAWNLLPEMKPATDIFLIPLGDVDVSGVADELRNRGVNVAVEIIDRKIDKSIRAAVKMDIPYALFVGETELKSGKYNLKNLSSSEEKSLTIDEITRLF